MSRIQSLSWSVELLQPEAFRSVCALLQPGLEDSIQVRSGSLPARQVFPLVRRDGSHSGVSTAFAFQTSPSGLPQVALFGRLLFIVQRSKA